MPTAVAREEHHFDIADSPLIERVRRPPERSLQHHLLDFLEPTHLVEAAPADNSEYVVCHGYCPPANRSGRSMLLGVELPACRCDIESPAFANGSGQVTVLEDRLK